MMKKQKEQEEHIAGLLKKLNKEKESKDNITKEAIGHMEKQLKNALNQNSIIKDGLAKKKSSFSNSVRTKLAATTAISNTSAKQTISKEKSVTPSQQKTTTRNKSPTPNSQNKKIKLENLNDEL